MPLFVRYIFAVEKLSTFIVFCSGRQLRGQRVGLE